MNTSQLANRSHTNNATAFQRLAAVSFQHKIEYVGALLLQQNPVLAEEAALFDEAKTKLLEIQNRFTQRLGDTRKETDDRPLQGAQIKALNHAFKEANKHSLQIIHQLQLELVAQRAETLTGGARGRWVRSFVRGMNQEGFKGFMVRLIARAFMITGIFQIAMHEIHVPFEGLFARMHVENKVSQLERRASVIFASVDETGSQWAIKMAVRRSEVAKQVAAFEAERLSQIERQTIEATFQIRSMKNQLIDTVKFQQQPLNETFAPEFAALGKAGISSMNRATPHLVNAWSTSTTRQENRIQAIRHGVIADPVGKTLEERKKHERIMALELVVAMALDQIRSLRNANQNPPTLDLTFASISLLTPDLPRKILEGKKSERSMLDAQKEALLGLAGYSLEVDGVKVTVSPPILFNFGVNAGAVGKLKWAPGLKLGLDKQYAMNQQALSQLKGLITSHTENKDPQVMELLEDIQRLLATKTAYQEGDNQYECAAKIVVLMNLLNKILPNKNTGYKVAFNCKSGKDRTGYLDAEVRALEMYRAGRRTYPTHEQLKTEEGPRGEFLTSFMNALEYGGGLDITATNTGQARGIKVQREARILGMSKEDFRHFQGLSSTTSG